MAQASTAVRQAAVSAVLGIRKMISEGELLPGQQIRQESMAEKLGMSRLPIREALRELNADGLVTHVPNAGYAVARLSGEEFEQIYLMRRLLETAVIESLPKPTDDEHARLVELNNLVVDAAESGDIATMRVANQEFHFAIFGLSRLELIIGEIERLWRWASPYHAAYLYSPESRETILREHQLMLDSLKNGDTGELARLMNQHREGAGQQVGSMLSSRTVPFRP